MKQIVIKGAGITGLSLAWYLHKFLGNRVKLTLVEKSSRVGGWIQTHKEDDFLFELGPRGFRPHGKGERTLELAKEIGLGPELLPAHPEAHRRYIYTEEKLHHVSPFFLLKLGLLSALWRERSIPPFQDEESIAQFFERRFNKRLTEIVIDPLVKGIFAGDASELSMRACFPLLSRWEREYGSVVKGFLRERKKKKTKVALYSFREGMESLTRRLAERIPAEILLNTENAEGDLVLSALPPKDYPLKSMVTVNLGYRKRVLNKQGFGYLIPSKEREPIWGMTWDSEIFPEQNRKGETRLTVMLPKVDNPLEVACSAAERHLQITEKPAFSNVSIAERAIPQFLVGLPLPTRGVGINESIVDAYRRAQEVANKISL